MSDYTKVRRDQFRTYLKTGASDWGLIGHGVTDYGISYNPQVETVKWIIHQNATSTLGSFQKQGDIEQEIYEGEPCFEYIYSIMDKVGSEVETEVLDIDTYKGTDGVYPAKKSKVAVVINNYMGEEAKIEYSIYYNGDPEDGTVTIDESGKPTFTKSGSI